MISPARRCSTEHDVEFALRKGGATLFFKQLSLWSACRLLHRRSDGLVSTDVKTYGGIELQCITAGSCFGIAEHDTDFSRNWLMKIQVVRVLLTAAVSFTQGL